MRLNNKGIKMTNWFNQSTLKAPLYTILAASSLIAASTEDTQSELTAKLDSIEQHKLGVSFEGEMNSRALSSEVYGPSLNPDKQTVENLFYTEMDLAIKGRPSTETEATLIFRLHQDWNNYYDEGVNPINSRWMSYDGSILNDAVQFNLGDFYFQKSPLVAYNPGLSGLENEAEIFTRKRIEAQEEKMIDGNKRHLQGFNATWTLNHEKPTRFAMTGTVARLRFPWWSNGILQYDNDNVSKYLGHVDGDLTIKEMLNIGMSYSVIYDRVRSTRSHNFFNEVSNTSFYGSENLIYENNNIASAWAGFDYNKANPKSNLVINARGDLAISEYWKGEDRIAKDSIVVTYIDTVTNIKTKDTIPNARKQHFNLIELETRDGMALLFEMNVGYKMKNDSYILNAYAISNNEEFVSDLAQSQNFLARSIFNSQQQTGLYGSGTAYNSMFEALYNHAFVVSPVTERTTMETSSPADPEQKSKYSGTNNYFRAQYEKNSYTGVTSTQEERDATFQALLPFFQDALPNGKATANRVGGEATLDLDMMDNMLSINANYGSFENVGSQEIITGTTAADSLKIHNMSFNRMGAGAIIRLGGVLKYEDGVEVSVGFGSQNSEVGISTPVTPGTLFSAENSTTFLSTGLKVGFLKDFELLAGYQQLDHDLAGFDVKENIMAAGLNYKLTKGSYVSAEVSQITGESKFTKYTQLIPQMNMTVKF